MLFINISNLTDNPGAKLTREGVCDYSEAQAKIRPLVRNPVSVSVTAYNDSGEIFIEMSVQYTLSLECDRCARDYEIAHSEVFRHKVGDAESELGELLQPDEEGNLPIDPIVWDDMMYTVPFHSLCRPDCKGLCINCGKNFNDGPCGCSEPRPVLFEDEQ